VSDLQRKAADLVSHEHREGNGFQLVAQAIAPGSKLSESHKIENALL
jgi:hypothetical protein